MNLPNNLTLKDAGSKQTANCLRMPFEEAQAFEGFLNYLWENYGFDFTGYNRPSLMRRVQGRMEVVGIAEYRDYIDYLKEQKEESTALYQFIPVNLTAFFRDPLVWDNIASEVIPRIVANKSSDEMIKVWSAGCASGEEAYTLAILLLEALGVEQFKQRVRIFGTDIDSEAIAQARLGCYSQDKVVGVPPAILARYFERTGESYVFRQDLRRSIIFTERNLLQDAPLSKVDLLVCRNTLIYFNMGGQIRALVRFHFALKDSGFLVLGKTEAPTPETDSHLFTLVNQQHRIFAKGPKLDQPRLLIKAFQNRKPSLSYL